MSSLPGWLCKGESQMDTRRCVLSWHHIWLHRLADPAPGPACRILEMPVFMSLLCHLKEFRPWELLPPLLASLLTVSAPS